MAAPANNKYGSDHSWEFVRTAQVGSQPLQKNTVYVCRDCGAYFEHYYDVVPDIHEAMRQSVDDFCPWKGDRDSLAAAKCRHDAAAAQCTEALRRLARAKQDVDLAVTRRLQAYADLAAMRQGPAQAEVKKEREEID